MDFGSGWGFLPTRGVLEGGLGPPPGRSLQVLCRMAKIESQAVDLIFPLNNFLCNAGVPFRSFFKWPRFKSLGATRDKVSRGAKGRAVGQHTDEVRVMSRKTDFDGGVLRSGPDLLSGRAEVH